MFTRARKSTPPLGDRSSLTGDVGIAVGLGEGWVSIVGSHVGSYVGRSPFLPEGVLTGDLVGLNCGTRVGLALGAGVGLATGAGVGEGVFGFGLFDGDGVSLFEVGSIRVGRLVGRVVGLPSSSATLIPDTPPSEVTT